MLVARGRKYEERGRPWLLLPSLPSGKGRMALRATRWTSATVRGFGGDEYAMSSPKRLR